MRRRLKKTGVLTFLGVTALAVAAWSLSPFDERVVPSGTDIKIQTAATIDSKAAQEGQSFPATIAENVVSSTGEILIAKGSDASLTIRKAGGNDLLLDLQSVTVAGKTYAVNSGDLNETNRRAGIGKNSRTAKMVGGGAVVGTIIGAIAGHGKGAAVGAVTGAAAGGAAQVLTKGKEIRVPAESILTFRLNAPLQLAS